MKPVGNTAGLQPRISPIVPWKKITPVPTNGTGAVTASTA